MDQKRNLNKIKQPKYIYFIICISSVLFIFGIIGWLISGSRKVEQSLRESFLIHIYIKDDASQDAKDELFEKLKDQKYVKHITFKSKEKALEEWLKDGGEEFINYTNENLLPESIVLNVNSSYVSDVMIQKIKNILSDYEIVSDIKYMDKIFNQFDIIKKIVFYLFIIAAFLIIISLVILGYIIRLIIYNNRFVIRTMTLVGASNRFISRPFELRAILNGLISSLIAISGIMAVAWYLSYSFQEIKILIDKEIFITVFVIIIFLGVFISWLSTYISIARYLKAPLEKLY